MRQEIDESRKTDSGRKDTSSEEDDSEVKEVEQDEEEDEEVGVISATPLRFPRQLTAALVTTSPSLTAPHVHTMADVHIPRFRQFRQPVVMTPVTLNPRPLRAAGSASQLVAAQPSGSQGKASPTDTPMGT